MPITIPDNNQLRPAHEFLSWPGVAKVDLELNGPVAVSATGTHESGVALFEPIDGTNNDGYVGFFFPAPASARKGVAALRSTIIAGVAGVQPQKPVYLGQDGSLTQDVTSSDEPSAGPTLTQSTGAGVLAAGTYTVGYSYVDADGETILGPTTNITIVASKQIDVTAVTPLPTGVTAVRWYMSIAPGSATLKRVAQNNGAAFSINALPTGNAASPLTSVAHVGSRRIGVGFTPFLIAID